MTVGGLRTEVSQGALQIIREGKNKKLVNRIGQITFNGQEGLKKGKDITYVTERGVFKLRPEGVVLTEIAVGIDLQRDIKDQSEFEIKISPDLKEMDKRLFQPDVMGLKKALYNGG
jgi:acyl CoA:acetate/3-ketoacid CoA transferase